MNKWFFYIIQGPQKGFKFPAKKNITIGKEAAQVNLEDPKLSKIHAQVLFEDGLYHLADSNSKNGLWLGEKRIKKVELYHGLRIILGDCILEVRNKNRKIKPARKIEKSEPPPAIDHFELISKTCSQLSKNSNNKEKNIIALNPPLILNFIKGLQAETTWHLGYGPRKAGNNSLDLPIFEDNAPDTCFEIRSSAKGNILKTSFPKEVLINGQAKESIVLQDGDVISIYNTQIKVNLVI